MRSSLKNAEGLGASGEGSHHWWVQRVSAVLLVPLTLVVIFCLLHAMSMDLAAAKAWVSEFYVSSTLALFVTVALYHSQLGLQVVLEDYVSHHGWRIAFIFLMRALMLLAGTLAVFSILRIAL